MTNNALPLPGCALMDLMQAVHAKGLPFRFSAGGYSMSPLIRDGDIMSVSPLSSRPPGRGEVVAFIHPETQSLCIHRVLSRKNGNFFIQGDNMAGYPDGLIPKTEILGRVTRVERKGKRIRLGLGPERILLAFFIRCGLFTVIRRLIAPLRSYARKGKH